MRTDGYMALLGFYNQTYHAITMAASLHSIGRIFRIDVRLANNMHDNAGKVIRDFDGLQKKPEIMIAWEEAKKRLEELMMDDTNSDHSSFIYELCALAFLSWNELCNSNEARQCAEEHYTVVRHPDLHPGLGAIKATWSGYGRSGNNAIPATFSNIAAILKGMGKK